MAELRSFSSSDRASITDVQVLGAVDPNEQLRVTLVLRRRSALPEELVTGPDSVTASDFAERYGTDPADLATVESAVAEFGLQVVASNVGARRVVVAGSAAAMSRTFGCELSRARSSHPGTGQTVEYRYRTGALSVPTSVADLVEAVIGLDDRPQARYYSRIAAQTDVTYTPIQVGQAYGFPDGDGRGQTVAIIELGGGFDQADLDSYFASLGISTPAVTAASVDGGKNTPGQDPTGADGEVLLDIEVVGALVPDAAITVYFAPNTDQGFVDAVSTAVHASPTPAAVSISWGGPESSWTAQSRSALDAAIADAGALGVTVCTASGDNGSSDGSSGNTPEVDFPAASPHALACGGTSLQASDGTISSETVWNDGAGGGSTGGGVSETFVLPSWQRSAGVPAPAASGGGRGVPDVAGDADPRTGYQVLVDGKQQVIGGTSAVAPLWAALVTRLAQSAGRGLGLLQPVIYRDVAAGKPAPGFRDITAGSNGAYSAGPGWDSCTGLGSPSGGALLGVITSASRR